MTRLVSLPRTISTADVVVALVVVAIVATWDRLRATWAISRIAAAGRRDPKAPWSW